MSSSTFSVPKMDCAAEERLVRMALEGRADVRRVDIHLQGREATVFHEGEPGPIDADLGALNLGSRLRNTTRDVVLPVAMADPASEAHTLRIVQR
jgi:hypothetical protein